MKRPAIGGTLASVAFHLAIAAPFIVHFAQKKTDSTAAAVMVEFSPEFEVALIQPALPPGVSQQRKVEAMAEEETAREKEMPKLRVQDDAELKLAAAAPEHRPRRKTKVLKKSQREQREEKGNSTITSLAAPPVQAVQTQRNAAPIDTDSQHASDSKMSWESLVKGKINRQRNYPIDARKRNRTGTAVIAFSVNERGDILTARLISSSGTLSLDRAALAAVENARPLPPPPKEILKNGMQNVTLPVEFGLLKI